MAENARYGLSDESGLLEPAAGLLLLPAIDAHASWVALAIDQVDRGPVNGNQPLVEFSPSGW